MDTSNEQSDTIYTQLTPVSLSGNTEVKVPIDCFAPPTAGQRASDHVTGNYRITSHTMSTDSSPVTMSDKTEVKVQIDCSVPPTYRRASGFGSRDLQLS